MSQTMSRELSYSVLQDVTSVERRPAAEDAVRCRAWVVCVGGLFFRLTWSSRGAGHGLPECRAYACDEAGNALSAQCLACCYCVNPHVAFAEVMDQLLALSTRQPHACEGATVA